MCSTLQSYNTNYNQNYKKITIEKFNTYVTLNRLEIVGQYLSLLFHNSYFALYAAVNQSKNKPACRLCICRLVFYRKNTILLFLSFSTSSPFLFIFATFHCYIPLHLVSLLSMLSPFLSSSLYSSPTLLFTLFLSLSFTPLNLIPRYYLLQAGLLSL